MRYVIGFALIVAAASASAQNLSLDDLQKLPEGSQRELNDITTETQDKVVVARGAVVRALDKISGEVKDLDLDTGASGRFGRIDVTLGECRYPEGNPSGDAYAYLVVRDQGHAEAAFQGWMVASSPALNSLDHARYDVWLLRCKTS